MGLETIAYKFALDQPIGWDQDCDLQLRKQNILWNKLVEIERAHRDAARSIVAEDPDVAAAEAKYTDVCERLAALQKERARRRANARSKVKADTADLDEEIEELTREKAHLEKLLRELKRAARAAARERLNGLESERIAAVKAARQAANADGCWWGNANAVIQSYEVGRGKALRENAELRFRRFDGEGRITNQIPGGMSPAELMGSANNLVRIGPPPASWRRQTEWRRCRLVSLTATVFTERGETFSRRTVTWPMFMTRELPTGPEDRVQQVSVHRRRHGDRWKWHAVITVRQAAPERTPSEDVVAINLGWRSTPTGLRVATILRDGAAEEPAFVRTPTAPIAKTESLQERRGEIDRRCDEMEHWLRDLDMTFSPEPLAREIEWLRARERLTGSRLERLRVIWEQHAPAWRLDELRRLQEFGRAWRLFDRNYASGRRWLENARREHYRDQIRQLVADAGTVIINAHDMSETAKATDSELPEAARRNRVLAAPCEFRLQLMNHCRKTGGTVIVREEKHDRCGCHGVPLRAVDRAALYWTCRVSGQAVDQDEDYCRLMLREWSREATNPEGARAAQQPEKRKLFRADRRGARRNGGEDGARSNPAP